MSDISPYMKQLKELTKTNRTAINGLTFGFTVAGFTFGTLLQEIGFLVAQLGSRSTIAIPSRLADTIIKLKPSVITGTPLDFMSWMQIIFEKDKKKYTDVLSNLKFLLSTAEPCAISRQEQIKKFFNISHVNTYASVDGFISFDCPCGEKHVLDELLYIELYDKDKKLIGNKGTGRLCFTNLQKKSTPMIKYLLDDLITIKDSENCPYGFEKAVIPHGRYELSININNKLLGNLDFEEIIFKYGLFMDYRVDIYDDRVDVLLEEYPMAKADYRLNLLKEEMSDLIALECKIKLVPLGKLTPYKEVRSQKSIIKIKDHRECSTQTLPTIL